MFLAPKKSEADYSAASIGLPLSFGPSHRSLIFQPPRKHGNDVVDLLGRQGVAMGKQLIHVTHQSPHPDILPLVRILTMPRSVFGNPWQSAALPQPIIMAVEAGIPEAESRVAGIPAAARTPARPAVLVVRPWQWAAA
jgi:hypothetical protein